MKKIVFNGLYFASQDRPTGIARHTFEILKELDKIVSSGQFEILAPECDIDTTAYKNIKFIKIGYYLSKTNGKAARILRIIWQYIIFPAYCFSQNAFTVNTGTAWKHYNFDGISIYDCTPERFYANSSYKKDFFWMEELIRTQESKTKTCKLILTDSQSAKADICRIYHVSEEKVQVIPCGWQHFNKIEEDPEMLKRLGIERHEFFFSLGSRMPHKNIKWISAAAKKHPQYIFVVTGSLVGKNETGTYFEGEIPGNMFFTGYLKDEEIKSLMRHCKAFIQPSLNEGFGIPPMEAMSVGADCIVSNAGSLPEVYKNSVWYIDPYDYENIDLDEIMSRPKESNDIILNEYSWEKSAKKLLEVLRTNCQ